jgi:hypothetical protein
MQCLKNAVAWKRQEKQKIIAAARIEMVKARNKAWFKFMHSDDISDAGVKDWMQEHYKDYDLWSIDKHASDTTKKLETIVRGTDPDTEVTMQLSLNTSALLEKWLNWSPDNGS